MITRRQFGIASGAAALGAPLGVRPQHASGAARLGILYPGTHESSEAYYRAFFESLAAAGYVEGTNLAVERRFANGRSDRLDAFARELVAAKVDVIYAPPTPAALAAKNATKQIPIVFSMTSDPIGVGLVGSLSRPEANVTGLSTLGRELTPKRVELLREIVPDLRRIGVLYDLSREPAAAATRDATRRTAESLGVSLIAEDVHSREQIAPAFAVLKDKRVDALMVLEGALALANRDLIIAQAASTRIPALYTYPEYPADGGLMSYSASIVEQFRRAAVLIAKLFRGARPSDIPVEQPTKFELVVNLKAARALGIRIPQSVLVRADKVIE